LRLIGGDRKDPHTGARIAHGSGRGQR
jgi:hypothetical protein